MNASFDFRAQQDRARRASIMLVGVFLVVTAAISLALGLLVAAGLAMERYHDPYHVGEFRIDPMVLLAVAAIAMAVIVVVALGRLIMFGGDGAKVARSLGAEEVREDVKNPYKRRYLNIVDEMSLAANLPRPRVFVLKHEQGINAFAAGSSPNRAAVAVTHGALAKLNREELSGVVAHEMAHIANRDSQLYMRLMAMVFGLVALYTAGRVMLRSFFFMRGRRDGRSALPAIALGVGLVVLGLVGVFAGRVLQSAISRRREYLADATGVQFTRNPSGLANALKKIGATAAGSHVDNGHAEEARHMFFASATSSLLGLFATHPPLEARIRALDPQFDPKTDPVWNKDDREILRETRRDLGVGGPWG